MRDKVVNAAKEKCGLQWEGCRFSVFHDMMKRKTFTLVKGKLQEFNMKYAGLPSDAAVQMEGKESEFHQRQ